MKKNIFIILLAVTFTLISCSKENNNSQVKNIEVDIEEKTDIPNVNEVEIANLVKSGKVSIKDEEWEKAEIIYKKILEKNPDNKSAQADMLLITQKLKNKNYYMTAIKLFTDKKYKESIDTFNKIPEKTTYRVKYEEKRKKMYFEKLLKLSDAELDAKNYDKVKELLSIATPMYPEEEGIIIRNKFIAQKTKDTNLAKSLIKEAQVLKTNKEYKKAIQKMEKAIEADPFYSNGYYIKAMIYKEMGENKLAIKFFNGYLELVPKASNVSEIKNTIKKLESTK